MVAIGDRPAPRDRVRRIRACAAPCRIDPEGLTGPTRGEAYGPQWRRSSHGFYVPADEDALAVDQRIVEAAAVLPSYGGVTGWAALRWLGALWFSGLAPDGSGRPVTLAVGESDVRPAVGIAVSAERLDPSELTIVDELRVTTALRSTTFEMRYAPGVRTATAVADMAMYADLVSVSELALHAAHNHGWTGSPRFRQAIALADENSWSPQETLSLRLPWILDAQLPRPLCNRPIFDRDGRHIATPDLLDEEAGVVGEYDGPVHLAGQRRGADVRREAALRRVGLETFVVTAADGGDREGVVRRMLETRQRARFESPTRRAWTIEPPHWWTLTTTVAARRALDEEQRRRFLAYRIS
jgi:hypothetical protein